MLSMHFCLIQLPEIHINYNLEKKKKNNQENFRNCLKWKKRWKSKSISVRNFFFLKGEVNGWAFCFQNNFLENWTGLCIYIHICMHVIKIAFGKWIPILWLFIIYLFIRKYMYWCARIIWHSVRLSPLHQIHVDF